MATITRVQARFLGNSSGKAAITKGGAEYPNIKETASQSYGAGAPVYYDSNGTIAVAVATSNTVRLIAGFAPKAATGTTGEPVFYRPLKAGDLLVVNCMGTSTTVTSLAQVGDVTNFDLHTGNLLVANPDSTTDTYLLGKIVGLYTIVGGYADGDVVGDTYGRLIVEIMDNIALQG